MKNQINNKDNNIECYSKLIFVFTSVLFLAWMVYGYFTFNDFKGQWAICAYGIRGIDPYAITGQQEALIGSIGRIPADWGTSPWGILLGSLIYPGFLSFDLAICYFLVINTLIFALTGIAMSKELHKIDEGISSKLVMVVTFLSLDFYISFFHGNAGGILSCLIVIGCLYCDKKPMLAGVCFGIAMIKPQLALLFCFVLLLQKKLLPLIIAAFIDVISLVGASIITKTSVFTLLKEFLNTKTGGNNKYFGIFTLLKDLSPALNDKHLLIISMLLGILVVFALNYKISSTVPLVYKFIPAAFVSSWWSYTWCNDHFIVIVASVFACAMIFANDERKQKIKWAVIAFVCSFRQAFYVVFRAICSKSITIHTKSENLAAFKLGWHIENTVYSIILMGLCIFIVNELNKRYDFSLEKKKK